MGAFTFENQALGAFLVYRLEGRERLDQLAMGMLTHNRIPGILPVNSLLADGTCVVRFPVSSLTALMGYWGGAMGRRKLMAFLVSFCRAVLECQEYMLDPGQILLAWDQVFVEPLSGEARLAYLPVMEGGAQQPAPEVFLQDLLQRTTFAPDEDSSHIPVLLNAVHMPNFSVEAFYDQLKKLAAEPKRSAAPQPVRPAAHDGEKAKKGLFGFGGKTEKGSSASAGRAAGGPVFAVPGMEPGEGAGAGKEKSGLFGKRPEDVQPARPVQPVPRPVRPVQAARGGGGTVLLAGDGAARTVSLEDMEQQPRQPEAAGGKLVLVRRLTGERAVIDKPIFHVGRESRVVDFCLTGGRNWVGTDHAYFLQKPDGVYLVDNNSLNHTWLNGRQLVSNQPSIVRPGDVVKMADEEFDVLPG